jgi:hypothetical protein
MLKNALFTLMLLSINVFTYSQVRKIQIISEETLKPIEGVEVYNGDNMIDKSDSYGFIEINFSKTNLIYLIKDGFMDVYFSTNQIESKLILTLNKPIEIKEIVIRKLSDSEILDSIKINLSLHNKKYLIPNYFKMSNVLKSEKDTLHYVNSLFKYDKQIGFQIDKKSNVIKNFTSKMINNNEILTYKINNKEIEFWEYLTVSYIKINGQLEISKILNNRNKYNFDINSDSTYYKVNFKSKKKGNLSFNGYLLVDKTNFGIHEFQLNLSDYKNNNIKLLTSQNKIKQSFDVLETDYFIKYHKGVNDEYHLQYSFLNQSFIQKEGAFQNKKFIKKSTIESSYKFNTTEFLPFDIFNYNIK